MSSAGNIMNDLGRHGTLRTVAVDSDYTVRTGRATDSLIMDSKVEVTTTADGSNLTMTVPNGVGPMQMVMIELTTQGDDETVAITTTTGADYTLDTAADYVVLMWTGSTNGWVALASETA